MKALIFAIHTCLIVTLTAISAWAFESANYKQERIDHLTIQALALKDTSLTTSKPNDENSLKRDEMQRVYSLIQDEVAHIFPLFIGALEGQGAGTRFSVKELQEICSEVRAKLAYSRSCLHAAKVAAGLNKEEVQNLHERRKKHREIYYARINSLNSKTGVASR